MSDISRKLLNPYLVLSHLCRYFPFRLVSDETYLKLFFRGYQGTKLNLDNPRTYNEKLQWLKLYDRNPEYTNLSDKYKVRDYVSRKIGKEYLIPLLGVWENAEDINFDNLPDQFVLKCNHDSGSVIICKDKRKLDIDSTVKKLNKALHYQYFWKSREWNYKNIERRIIAEKMITDQSDDELTDYKYFCFDGEPKFIQVDSGRFTDHIRNFYDTDWNFINAEYGCKNDPLHLLPEPEKHKEMLKLTTILSEGMPHVRVDFYLSGDSIYFGELTFHHGGGVMVLSPKKYDYIWGDFLKLPKKTM